MAEEKDVGRLVELQALVDVGSKDPRIKSKNAWRLIRKAGLDVAWDNWRAWVRSGRLRSVKVFGKNYVYASSIVDLLSKSLELTEDEREKLMEAIDRYMEGSGDGDQ